MRIRNSLLFKYYKLSFFSFFHLTFMESIRQFQIQHFNVIFSENKER